MKSILVIDDVAMVRRSVDIALRKGAFVVRQAESVEAARALMRAERFDIVITDILMPGEDGLVAIDWVRENAPDTKIIAMSGGGSLADVEEALALAARIADGSIRKPFDRDELLAIIDSVLGGT